jgi:hypothetical protein
MAVLTITIVDPSFEKKSSEIAYLRGVLRTLEMELGRGNGTVTSGTIMGTSPAGTPNTSLGSWTYIASGSKP